MYRQASAINYLVEGWFPKVSK